MYVSGQNTKSYESYISGVAVLFVTSVAFKIQALCVITLVYLFLHHQAPSVCILPLESRYGIRQSKLKLEHKHRTVFKVCGSSNGCNKAGFNFTRWRRQIQLLLNQDWTMKIIKIYVGLLIVIHLSHRRSDLNEKLLLTGYFCPWSWGKTWTAWPWSPGLLCRGPELW